MKILFKTTTQYTKKVYDDFLIFHTYKFGLKYFFITILTSLLIIYFFISLLSTNNYIYIILFLILFISFISYRFLKPKFTIKKEINSSKIQNCETYIFNFYDNNFLIETPNEKISTEYSFIKKSFETDKYYYLYISRKNAYIILKDKSTNFNYLAFSKFLHSKTNLKFIHTKK